ncbi:MAG: hypothetical protein HC858_03040 [Brachymonas sp.]|nr:hypothetical protein [Brachymonas sp.]
MSLGKGQIGLSFLSPTMARVSWQPSDGYREPRTWAIAPTTGAGQTADVPLQGRERASLEGFTPPPAQAKFKHPGDRSPARAPACGEQPSAAPRMELPANQ